MEGKRPQTKEGPPRAVEIDPERPFVVDGDRVYAVINGLRRRDIQDCTTVAIDHVAALLDRLLCLDELSVVPVGVLLDRMIIEAEGRAGLSNLMKKSYEKFAAAGAKDEFNAAVRAAHGIGSDAVDVAMVRLRHKAEGGSMASAIRHVGEAAAAVDGVTDSEEIELRVEALKQKMKRSQKRKT